MYHTQTAAKSSTNIQGNPSGVRLILDYCPSGLFIVWSICLLLSNCKMIGSMKKTIKPLILELLGGIFGLICVGAAIACVYFLYGAWANGAPWSYLLWSIGIGFIAMQIVAAVNGVIQRIEYVNHLIERGYSKGEAAEAWRTASNGGLNLLRNLQQAELSAQIDLLETAINTPNTDGDSS